MCRVTCTKACSLSHSRQGWARTRMSSTAMYPGWPWTETASNITWEQRKTGRNKVRRWHEKESEIKLFLQLSAASWCPCEAQMGSLGEFSTKSQPLFLFSLHHFCFHRYANHICCQFSPLFLYFCSLFHAFLHIFFCPSLPLTFSDSHVFKHTA